MAFLCPSRRGRQKKKKESKAPFMGRITGSASVDTLVRVGLEKQHGLSPDSRMRVTQNFLATTDDELSAQTGDIVYKLFDDNEWVYVISEQGQEGFVPCICVTLLKDTSSDAKTQGSFKHKTKQTSSHLPQRSDDSMLAEEGSDASTGSREYAADHLKVKSKGADDIAPPKPARGLPLDVPDVIGGNHHHHHHNHHPVPQSPQNQHHKHHNNHHHNNSNQKQQNNITPDLQRIKSTGLGQTSTPKTSPKNCHNVQYSLPNKNKNSHGQPRISSPRGGGGVNGIGIQRNQRSSTTSSNITSQDTPLTSSQTSLTSDPITEVRTFSRKPRGKLLVIFPFEAWDEGDMSVDRGEVVTALNTEDPLWTMVRKLNGQEGFVPAAFTCNYPEDLPGGIGSGADNRTQRGGQQAKKPNYHDVRDLVTLRQFIAQSADDISVECGEQVFADLANQIERDWLWVYAPSTGKYGYIPRDNVVHADKTPLPRESDLRYLPHRPP